MSELVMIGFSEKHRAIEVLAQIQRLRFVWTRDLDDAIVVEVEADGRLRMMHSQLLDSTTSDENYQWKGLLSALVPSPHLPSRSDDLLSQEVLQFNRRGDIWLKELSLDPEFSRNAVALMQPGSSIIFVTIDDWHAAVGLLRGYSHFVLHTPIAWERGGRQVKKPSR